MDDVECGILFASMRVAHILHGGFESLQQAIRVVIFCLKLPGARVFYVFFCGDVTGKQVR